jgi:hypothetical protein
LALSSFFANADFYMRFLKAPTKTTKAARNVVFQLNINDAEKFPTCKSAILFPFIIATSEWSIQIRHPYLFFQLYKRYALLFFLTNPISR